MAKKGVGMVLDDEEIMSMIEEEVEPFFAGKKSAKDVANIIQGRVKIYVNENR